MTQFINPLGPDSAPAVAALTQTSNANLNAQIASRDNAAALQQSAEAQEAELGFREKQLEQSAANAAADRKARQQEAKDTRVFESSENQLTRDAAYERQQATMQHEENLAKKRRNDELALERLRVQGETAIAEGNLKVFKDLEQKAVLTEQEIEDADAQSVAVAIQTQIVDGARASVIEAATQGAQQQAEVYKTQQKWTGDTFEDAFGTAFIETRQQADRDITPDGMDMALDKGGLIGALAVVGVGILDVAGWAAGRDPLGTDMKERSLVHSEVAVPLEATEKAIRQTTRQIADISDVQKTGIETVANAVARLSILESSAESFKNATTNRDPSAVAADKAVVEANLKQSIDQARANLDEALNLYGDDPIIQQYAVLIVDAASENAKSMAMQAKEAVLATDPDSFDNLVQTVGLNAKRGLAKANRELRNRLGYKNPEFNADLSEAYVVRLFDHPVIGAELLSELEQKYGKKHRDEIIEYIEKTRTRLAQLSGGEQLFFDESGAIVDPVILTRQVQQRRTAAQRRLDQIDRQAGAGAAQSELNALKGTLEGLDELMQVAE